MDPVSIAQIVLSVASAVGGLVLEAITKGDASVLDRPLKDILPHELRSEIAKRIADEAAAKKFTPPA